MTIEAEIARIKGLAEKDWFDNDYAFVVESRTSVLRLCNALHEAVFELRRVAATEDERARDSIARIEAIMKGEMP